MFKHILNYLNNELHWRKHHWTKFCEQEIISEIDKLISNTIRRVYVYFDSLGYVLFFDDIVYLYGHGNIHVYLQLLVPSNIIIIIIAKDTKIMIGSNIVILWDRKNIL